MNITLEHILELDHFTPEDRVAIQNAVQSDKDLAKALRNWMAVSDHVKRSIETEFPSSEALVAFALEDQLGPFDGSSEERISSGLASDAVHSALTLHPSIRHIIARIQADALVFESCWNESIESIQPSNVKGLNRSTPDRSANAGPNRVMRLVRWSASIAAVITLLAIGYTQSNFNSATDPFRIETVAGELRTVTLEDGTTVRLSPSSSIAWNGDFNRNLTLDGSAFFDVVASPEPFTIETPQGKTTVLGTSFGMQTLGRDGNQDDNRTVVTLVSGRVSISLTGQSLDEGQILSPGMQGTISSSRISVQAINLTDALDWSDLIVFRDTPMKDVVDVLSKRFSVTINMPVGLNETPLTGTFEQERGIKEILEIVASALGAKVERDPKSGAYALSR